MPRRRYLDNAAPADATYNSIRPVYRSIQLKKKDTPQRRENEAAKARARAELARVTLANPRQASIGLYREKTAIDKAGGRLYEAGERMEQAERNKEEAVMALEGLFKPIMPSSYIDIVAAIKNGQANNVVDVLAAPYITGSWSQRNPGKALAVDILAPFALNKVNKLARFAGSNITNSWRDMRYALAHPESQVYRIAANSPYSIETLPGYHIGSLQRGNMLEKQLSKAGTISLKSVQGVINNPNTPKVDKYILKQVVNKHNGEKGIDYNTLRREAQEFIPKYNRVPKKKFADYGGKALGLTDNRSIDELYLARNLPEKYWDELKDFNRKDLSAFDEIDAKELYLHNHPEVFDTFKGILLERKPTYNTFTFESPGFIGNKRHYEGHPLGHTRTYVTSDEPTVLHVMESQSDWAQQHPGVRDILTQRELDAHGLNVLNRLLKDKYPDDIKKATNMFNQGRQVNEADFSDDFINAVRKLPQLEMPSEEVVRRAVSRSGTFSIEKRMVDTYLQRQLQENMLYGAERGKSLMRYPTPETAAKIEGYPKGTLTPEYKELEQKYNDVVSHISSAFGVKGYKDTPEGIKNYDLLHFLTDKMRGLKETNSHVTYAPEHQTILKKYSEFPKMFGKLFKGQQVRNVTDKLGNTWYEVDIPTDMLQRELKFKLGGRIIR